MNKRGGIVFMTLLTLLLGVSLIGNILFVKYQNDQYCEKFGHDGSISWNHKLLISWFVPEFRAYIECANGEESVRIYFDEVVED